MIATLITSMKNYDLVICGYRRISSQGRQVDVAWPTAEAHDYKDFLHVFNRLYSVGLINSPCNKIYLAELIKGHKLRFDRSINLGEDLLFNLSYLRLCHSIQLIPEVLYNYFTSPPTSLSKSREKGPFLQPTDAV